ncbi:hypothetical protein [Azospirillum sp.]|uniref:hypothetical protein n=1 Tax=Azospirillum sp. TaxID=34012 RepID=UPI002D64EB96|nr:hypothetical protein [Azospirillum sp.]HYD67892.1 hypothetical protein [Azospirillum sp.]
MPNFAVDPGLVLFLFNALAAWPLARVCRRAGLAPWWALLVFVPVVGLVLVMGVLTFRRWPNRPARPAPLGPKPRRTA